MCGMVFCKDYPKTSYFREWSVLNCKISVVKLVQGKNGDFESGPFRGGGGSGSGNLPRTPSLRGPKFENLEKNNLEHFLI